MISYKVTYFTGGKHYVEGFCLSTDTKPTENMANGTLEGTYAVEVYRLAYAPNGNPFA